MSSNSSWSADRRVFLRNSTAAVVGGAIASLSSRSVHAAGSDTLRVGLIGCGGRGSGAASDALNADANLKVTAMGDLFPDRAASARSSLKSQWGARLDVSDDRLFHGFDAYQKVIAADVDVVLLCTPPHFRPAQLRAAIEAGKHVFCEKPVAVDAPGVRNVLETCRLAKEKNLSVVSGLCWRYDLGVRDTMQRIKDGAIGQIQSIQENYLTGTLWQRPREPNWSEMEYQCRNWLYYTWLSGDHIVEQHIHSLDKALWLMNDEPPVKCSGLGGRQVRTESDYGNIFDHFAVIYEWASGVKTFAFTRQMKGCFGDVEDYVVGTKGHAKVLDHSITGENSWRYPKKREKPSMYVLEHQALYQGIRSGNIINNGDYMSKSTLLAIMGREACYTGQEITWDEAMNSTTNLSPVRYEWGDVQIPSVPVPGVSTFT